MAPTLTFKPLEPAALPQFARWVGLDIEQGLEPAYSLATLQKIQRDNPEGLLGVYVKRELIAGALLSGYGPTLRLDLLVITKAYRRQGIASALMDKIKAIARSQQATAISVMVRSSNHAALRLYAKVGAETVRLHSNYYPSVDDGLELRIALHELPQ